MRTLSFFARPVSLSTTWHRAAEHYKIDTGFKPTFEGRHGVCMPAQMLLRSSDITHRTPWRSQA